MVIKNMIYIKTIELVYSENKVPGENVVIISKETDGLLTIERKIFINIE